MTAALFESAPADLKLHDAQLRRRGATGVDLSDAATAAKVLAVGTRVTVKFAEQRKGEMLDFWFELAG